MEITKEKNRIYKFDNLKFFLILFVVLGHMVDRYINNDNTIYKTVFIFIYSFHMPLFIFLTGLFQKEIKYFKNLPLKKIVWYIFLVYFMKIMLCFFSICFNGKFEFSLFGGSSHYWFLWAITFYIIITPLIRKFKILPLLLFSIILAAFVGYDKNIGDQFQLSRIIIFFPFYLIGYGLKNEKDKLISFSDKRWVRIISLIFLLIFLYICLNYLDYIYSFRGIFTGRHSFQAIKNMTCTYNTRIIAYLISFIIGFSVLSLSPNKKLPIISKCGTRTLQIYV